jgi:hypothetical protein
MHGSARNVNKRRGFAKFLTIFFNVLCGLDQ